MSTATPPITPDRVVSIDLRSLPEDKMAALRRRAIAQGVSLSELFAELIGEASDRLAPRPHHQPAGDPDGRAAHAAGRGLDLPQPEGKN